MKRILTAVAGALWLTGCHTSPVPLGPVEEAEFDAAILGTWIEAEPTGSDGPDELVIRRAGEREYDIQLTSSFLGTRPVRRAQGHVIRIEGVPFLNVRMAGGNGSAWVFFRYELVGKDGLQLRSLKENVTDAESASELLAFVRGNLHRDELYTEAARFRRRE